MTRILILELDRSVRELLMTALEADGHDCFLAGASLPARDIDLMLVDPSWATAREFAARVREVSAGIPIILSSDIVQPGTDLEPLRPFRCVPRLFSLGELRESVRSALLQADTARC